MNITFGEPVWTFDYEANVANPEVEKYLIKIKFSIDGEKGCMLGEMSESPKDNPDLYKQKIQEMKDSLPGAYERGEIREPPGIIEV